MSLSPNSLSLRCNVLSPLFLLRQRFLRLLRRHFTRSSPDRINTGTNPCNVISSSQIFSFHWFFVKVLPALRFLGIFSFCDAFVRRLFTLGIAWEPKHFALGTCGAGAVPGKGERSAGKGRMKASSCGRVSPWSRSCRNWGGICRWNALELQRDNLPEFSSTHPLRNFKPIEIGRYF